MVNWVQECPPTPLTMDQIQFSVSENRKRPVPNMFSDMFLPREQQFQHRQTQCLVVAHLNHPYVFSIPLHPNEKAFLLNDERSGHMPRDQKQRRGHPAGHHLHDNKFRKGWFRSHYRSSHGHII